MDAKTLAGIIGVIGILAGFGGSQILTMEQLDKSYVCPLTEELAMFDRLSSSGKTGYYVIDGAEHNRACRLSNEFEPWIPLRQYAESMGVSVQEFLERKQETTADLEFAEVCGREGCFVCPTPVMAYTKCENTLNYAGEIILP